MKRNTFILAVALLALGAGAYFLVVGLPGRASKAPPPPELSGVEEAVAQKILSAHEVLASSPTEENWAQYGKVLIVHGHGEEAARAFLVAAKLADDPFEHYYHAGIALKHTEPAETLRFFEKALRYRGGYMPLRVFLGESYLAMGRLEDARAQFEAACKLESTSHCLLGLGRVALGRNDLPGAIAFLEQARKTAPRHREVLASLATAYQRAGSADKARQASNEARQADERTLLADPILNKGGDHAVSYHAFHTRAQNFFASERYDEALFSIEKALKVRPNYPDGLFLRAKILVKAGQLERAGRSFDEYLAVRRDPRGLHAKVLCLYQLGKFLEALPLLEEIYALDPEYIEARYLLAALLFQAGRATEGESHVKFVIQRQPRMAKARVLYARFLLEHGRKAEAEIEAKKALEYEPGNQRARVLLKDLEER